MGATMTHKMKSIVQQIATAVDQVNTAAVLRMHPTKATSNKFPVSRPGNGFLIQAGGRLLFLFKGQGSRLQEICTLTGTSVKIEFTERHPIIT